MVGERGLGVKVKGNPLCLGRVLPDNSKGDNCLVFQIYRGAQQSLYRGENFCRCRDSRLLTRRAGGGFRVIRKSFAGILWQW